MTVVKQNRLWNNIPVRIETNILTGAVEVYNVNAKLFSSEGGPNDWKVEKQVLANVWNTNNTQNILPDAAEKIFFSGEYQLFNNDRAAAINNSDNYTGVSQAVRTQKALAEQGVPDVINPVTGEQNNSGGVSVDSVDRTAEDTSTEVFNALGNIPEIEVNHSTDIYRYPLGRLPSLGYDFVEIRAYEYDAGSLRTSGKGSPRETFILPMIPSLEETNSTGWGDDNMNFINEIAATAGLNVLNKAASGAGFMEFGRSVIDEGKSALDKITTNPDMKAAIVAYFAGQAAGGVNVAARAGGAVINPNLELLFKGPNLRQFNFNFKLRPRDPDEAEMIRNMIRAFKKNMNPRRSAGNIFLKTPSIFTIKYTRNGGEHPFMNKIGDCALQNFRVNYTPDGNYMTYDDGSMTGYDISLQFSELFPIYADQQDEAGGTGF